MQCNAATIGMANQMNLVFALIDERNRSRGFVGDGEGVLTRPGSTRWGAVVLWSPQVEVVAERVGKSVPLAGAGARAMQGDHRSAAPSRRTIHVHGHSSLPSVFRLFTDNCPPSGLVPEEFSRPCGYRSGPALCP